MGAGSQVGSDWAPEVYGNYYVTNIPIYAAIKRRANSIVRPPLLVYEVGADGARDQVGSEHPAQKLLDLVNPFWSRGNFLRGLSTYLDIWGSAFVALKKTGPGAAPTEMWLLRPDRVSIIPSKESYIGGFVYDSGRGRKEVLLPEECIWFRYFNPMSEFAGLAPMAPLRLSADMHADALRHNRDQFVNQLNFSNVVITTSGSLTQDEMDAFRKRLRDKYAGRGRGFEPLILSNTAEAKSLGFSPREMEHVMTLRYSLEDVARVYDIPKILLGDLERATYSNVDAAERIYWRGIADYLAFLEEQFNEFLIPQFGPNLKAHFDLSVVEALQPDINAEADRARLDVSAGVVTINEVRADRDLPPVPWGDAWWPPAGTIPTDGSEQGPAGEAAIVAASQKSYKLWKPFSLTEEGMAVALASHAGRLGRREGRFTQMQRNLFDVQRIETLRRVRRLTHMGPVQPKAIEKREPDVIFDPEEWLLRFISVGKPVVTAALSEGAAGAIKDFGLGTTFAASAPKVQEWLADRLDFWARRVNDETARLIVSELQEARELGEGIPQMEERVSKVFGYSKGVRTEMIARTETQSAVNRGALEAYRQSGVVERKMWLSAQDERVRDSHAEAHGQTVMLDAPFIVGGESIMHPGDGSPGEAINCRCAIVPVLEARSARGTAAVPEGLATSLEAMRSEIHATTERVQAMGKPDPSTVVKTIEVDANGFPRKITEERLWK